ncbi:MAG: N-acetylneuraminate synthase family protein [Saprospiraceae bacterium]|jgi:N,N'-diacetyllegionaminate synthase|nr:N-acetylneuraminate synthase family protein [Saprospiraceae bacterium]
MMQSVKIGNRLIGENHPMMIIAELASSHEGRYTDMLKLIDFAIKTGADALKFQVLNQESHITKAHEIYDLVGQLEFSSDQWVSIMSYARQNTDMIIMTDVYDLASLEIVKRMNPDMVKIHSADLNNKQLVRGVAKLNKPSMIGIGASSLEEIRKAIHWFKEENEYDFLSLMHGYQGFPTKLEDMNISQLGPLKELFGLPMGFLDHAEGDTEESLYLAIAARAIGAFAVEKHIVLNRDTKGIDYQSALSMPFFKRFVNQIRNVESALGNRTPQPFSPGEKRYRDFMKKDIVAKEKIKKGEILTIENLTLKRSKGALSQGYYEVLLGKVARIEINKDENITLSKIK